MSDIVSPLLQWLNANPQWAGIATFIISAAESIAIIGTIVPGSITMTAIGTLAGAGIIPLWETILWAILGAVAGDGVSYWMGHYFKDRLRRMWPFKDNPGVLLKGEVFVHKYGVMSVFIGRFVGPVRALVPLVAGMLGMKPLQFTIANVTSAIGWAPAYMLPGILLGAASLELPPDIAMHAILVLMLITLFIMLCLWLIFKILQLISKQTEQMLVGIWNTLKKSRYFHIATVVLKHYDPREHHGQLTLAFYFLLTSTLFLCLVFYTKWIGPEHIFVNNALFHLFRGIRTPGMDNVMIDITLLGQKQIILPVVLVLFIWLLVTKRMRAAFHALALGVLAAGSVWVVKHIAQIPRPWGIFFSPESFSMPSGHTTLATTVYMGIAFIIASPMPQKHRWMIYMPAALVTFAVGLSRVYLGAHWFTDVLAAWLLSAALLMLVILSFHRQREKPISLPGISLVCISSLMICYAFYYHYHINQLRINYAQINWPTAEITLSEWWKKDESIPEFRVSLFGIPSETINIQWAGDLKTIRSTLLKEGWEIPPARDWISTLHRITDIKSSEFLPLVSPQYLDKKPALILSRRANGKKKLLVLRLWASNRTIRETKRPLWVGTVGIVPRSYSWLYRKHRGIEITPAVIFPNQAAWQHWEAKVIVLPLQMTMTKTIDQKILLIREK
ncbi:bifunctional DedA family/phosphatase PAP2 family protein [Aquicella lusitana]|uniref:Membrane protein DedA with SNARE-associated domain n=1 Tax=Aquicella lusitana TaxID=254246 RepID=A0A370GPH4_9COXI|nr:bifunctional DedA family/phosphatase PAP2 family protein [Aquicella lusitana]RDI45146.1 membrane protein DedA with SNARE-associated domain [Aquicella lusitana]VVC72784.1 Inner membrane protein YabI [Aquicella lusitana]